MTGFAVIYREASEHPLFAGDSSRLGAWVYLILKACWKPTRFNVSGKTVMLERGQFCCSVRDLADAWGWSKSSVDRFLSRLKTETMIGTESGTGRLIITICNYDKYQSLADEAGTDGGTPTGTVAGQQRDIKEQGNHITTLEEEAYASPSTGASDVKIGNGDQGLDPASAKPKRTRKPKAPVPEFILPDWVPADAWNGFVEMRIAKGARPTDRAMKLLVAKLDEFRARGHDPTKVLDQSTTSHWTDLYELKDNRNGKRGQTNRPGSPAAQRGGDAGQPRAGFQRRAFEAGLGQGSEAPQRRDDRSFGGDSELPLAPARLLP